MADLCCATCPAFVARPDLADDGRGQAGTCTLNPPTPTAEGDYQPLVRVNAVCSHHPLHPMQRHLSALAVRSRAFEFMAHRRREAERSKP